MGDCEARCRGAGTSDACLELVKGHDFLVRCLRKAKFEKDMVQDTVDACEINDLNALVLASGELTVVEASQQLFLMQEDRKSVV